MAINAARVSVNRTAQQLHLRLDAGKSKRLLVAGGLAMQSRATREYASPQGWMIALQVREVNLERRNGTRSASSSSEFEVMKQ